MVWDILKEEGEWEGENTKRGFWTRNQKICTRCRFSTSTLFVYYRVSSWRFNRNFWDKDFRWFGRDFERKLVEFSTSVQITLHGTKPEFIPLVEFLVSALKKQHCTPEIKEKMEQSLNSWSKVHSTWARVDKMDVQTQFPKTRNMK